MMKSTHIFYIETSVRVLTWNSACVFVRTRYLTSAFWTLFISGNRTGGVYGGRVRARQ